MPRARKIDHPLDIPMSSKTTSPYRFDAIDWIKSIGIVLVIYGHCEALNPAMEKAIYGFHMPLFFFASGFLMSENRLLESIGMFLKYLFRRLVLPYLIFALFNYALWLIVFRHFGADSRLNISPLLPVAGILYGSGSVPSLLQPQVLWFFPCLVSASILMWLIFKLPKRFRILTSVGITLFGLMLPFSIPLPWELEDAVIAQLFMNVGFLSRENWSAIKTRSTAILFGAAIISGAASWICSQWNVKIDMRASCYGDIPLFLTSSFLGVASLVTLAAVLPKSQVARHLSEASLIAFPLHSVCFSILMGFYVFILQQSVAFRNHPLVGIVASFCIILFFYFISKPSLTILNKLTTCIYPESSR